MESTQTSFKQSLNQKIATHYSVKEIATRLSLQNSIEYQRLQSALTNLSENELQVLNKVCKKILQQNALPTKLEVAIEAINISIINQIKIE